MRELTAGLSNQADSTEISTTNSRVAFNKCLSEVKHKRERERYSSITLIECSQSPSENLNYTLSYNVMLHINRRSEEVTAVRATRVLSVMFHSTKAYQCSVFLLKLLKRNKR